MLRLRARLRATLRTRAGDAGDASCQRMASLFGRQNRVDLFFGLALGKTLANVTGQTLSLTLGLTHAF